MARIRYHAGARDLTGVSEETVPLEGGVTLPQLVTLLGERHPRLRAYLPRMRLALNGEFAARTACVLPDDEIDVLPPVAGGCEPVCLVDVRDHALSIDEVFAAVGHPAAGGVALFVGVVRDHADGKTVARLDYEAHVDLAIKETTRILATIAREIPETRLAAVHRVGSLKVGDYAVVIGVSAPHREEAFRGCRLAIDRIKETVPIWKKEWAPDGTAYWVNLEEE